MTSGDVLAVLQGVEGIIATDLNRLGANDPVDGPRLLALPARVESSVLRPAQLLTLAPDALHSERSF